MMEEERGSLERFNTFIQGTMGLYEELYPLEVTTTEVADASSPTCTHPEQRPRTKVAVVGEMNRRQADPFFFFFSELDDYDEH